MDEDEDSGYNGIMNVASSDIGADGNTRASSISRTINESQFMCPCCYQLMLEPTTLTCGHSFCRYCLAKWTETSGNRVCPECRQVWVGTPNVNFTLRDTIIGLFPEKHNERRNERSTDYDTKIQKFNQFVGDGQPIQETGVAFIYGSGCALGLVLIVWLYSWLGSPNYSLLVHKPVTSWTPNDVSGWIKDLGGWAEGYADDFLHKGIDGYLLLAITDDYLTTTFNMPDLHRRAFLMSMNNVNELGVKSPTTLWEYKELYPRKFFFLMSTIQVLPRSIFLYTYLYEYDDTFLPFIHSVSPGGHMDLNRPHQLPSPSTKQWIAFLPPSVMLPYLCIAQFAWLWFSVHFITVTFVFIICMSETFQDANSIVRLYQSVTRGQGCPAMWNSMKSYARSVFGQCVLYVLLPIMPWVVCEIYFYFCVYVIPLQTIWGWLVRLYSKFNQQVHQ